jgi:hypothetical protein
MNTVKRFTSVALIALLLASCDPCRNLDCITSDYTAQLRLVGFQDGHDYIFGPNRLYDKDQIRFYALKGTDTTFLEHHPVRAPGQGYDSIIHVLTVTFPEVVYMRLTNTDTDTLRFTYSTRDTRCCGNITSISNLTVNNRQTVPVENGTLVISKIF